MKCESGVSSFCKKTIPKHKAKHIWVDNKPLEVCGQCFWILKQRAKQNGNGGNPTGRRGKTNTSTSKLKTPSKPFKAMLKQKRSKKAGNHT